MSEVTAPTLARSGKKRLANANAPILEAVIAGLYRFETLAQAQKIIDRITSQYALSKHPLPPEAQPATALWIKEFNLTTAETAQGALGNVAMVRIQKIDTKYTITAQKLPVPIEQHPQRKRTVQKHPDWGHPILRAVKRKRAYGSLEDARRELLLLHEQFPEVSIPGNDKLQIMIYSKREKGALPVQKVQIRIEALTEGQFYLRQAEPTERKTIPTLENDHTVHGKFTALVELKRKRRKI